MSRHQPWAGWIGRIGRRIGCDRNPMRRGSDRLQASLRAGLLAVFALGGPVTTAYACHWAYAAGLRTARAQTAAWHRVPALVLHVSVIATAWRHPLPTGGPAALSVRWAPPDGLSRTGQVGGSAGDAVGRIVTVWVDASGRLAHPPLTHADVVAHVIGAAVATPAVLALVLWVAAWAASLFLDRYRLARWEADWLTVEPRWTGQR